MQFTIGQLKNNTQVNLFTFQLGVDSRTDLKTVEVEDLKTNPLEVLYLDEEKISSETLAHLSEEQKFFPIRDIKTLAPLWDFETINFKTAYQELERTKKQWALTHNLNLLDDLFTVINHLKSLWPNDRSTFFQELWFMVKNNLGAGSLSLIYHDLEKSKKETERDKLINIKVTGDRFPNPVKATDIDTQIIESYAKEFGPSFEVSSWDVTESKLVAIASIKNSPILIMAENLSLTPIQSKTLKALFDGLNQLI